MPVELKHKSAEARATFSVGCENAVMLRGIPHIGREIVPTAFTARWLLVQGAWVLDRVTVTGDVVNHNGVVSQVSTVRKAHTRYGKWVPGTPQWLKDAVADHDPSRGSER